MKGKLFVLKTTKYGDSDLIIRTLDRTGAKLSLVARSALKSKKRFGGGVLQPTHLISAEYEPPKNEDGLGHIKEAELIEGFSGLRLDFDRLQAGLHFVTLIDKTSQEGNPDSEHLFDLLGHGLRAVEFSKRLNVLRVHFELKLLAHQGVLPALTGIEPFLNVAIRDHEAINSTEAEVSQISNSVSPYLSQYLQLL